MTENNGDAEAVAQIGVENATENGSADLHKKIIRQIEYYFGDYNLGRDKFLREMTTSNEDGWVPLETLVKFKRLQSLTTDFEVIATSIKKSDSGLLEVNDDKTKIRRSKDKPLPSYDEARKEDVDSRSAYVKGFAAETTIDQLLSYFKEHGNVEHIQMRYRPLQNKKDGKSSVFKGSVFIVFPSKEELEEFLNKEELKYEDKDLNRESKESYAAKKTEQREKYKEKIKKIKEEKKKDVKDIETKVLQYEKGCVLHLSNFSKDSKREDIKDVFNSSASVAYIGYNIGDEEALIRFREPKAQEAMDKVKESNDGKIEMKGVEVTARVIEGDEEEKYYEEYSKNLIAVKQRRDKSGRGGRGGRGGRFGRGFGGRGGRFGRDNGNQRSGFKHRGEKRDDEPATKKPKIEINE